MPEAAEISYRCQKGRSERDDTKCLWFAVRSGLGSSRTLFSTSESWHTANVLLGVQQTSRHWHIDISELSRTRNHSLAPRPNGVAQPPLHSIALGYRSSLGLVWCIAGKKTWLLHVICFYQLKISGKNSASDWDYIIHTLKICSIT